LGPAAWERVAELTEHSDLAHRLQAVPSSAQVRGLYFTSIVRLLEEEGKAREFEQLFGMCDHAALGWYPASDFLVRLAVGGALLESPERVHRGMFRIGRLNASAFCDSLLGKLMIRLFARDPHRLLRQASAAREQSFRFGRWNLQLTGSRSAVMNMYGEYVWIESNLLGAAVGTFEAIGMKVRVEYELDGPFDGKHYLIW
jgi:uncharacterized protein (TIGR02265 family)